MNISLLEKDYITQMLTAVVVLLQIPLLLGSGSIFSLLHTYYQQYQIIKENKILYANNQILVDKINALQSGTSEIEARARLDLGLIKKNEMYYQVITTQQE